MTEFHVSRQSRDLYQFDQSLYNLRGNVIFANLRAARLFAQKMNERRDLVRFPEQAVKPGEINALGLLDEILHVVVQEYQQQANPGAMEKALNFLETRLGQDMLDRTLVAFNDAFPPLAVYRREMTVEDFLNGETDGVSNRVLVLEEMLMLWLTNSNPAALQFSELFDDSDLRKNTAYLPAFNALHEFFETQPKFGPDGQNLIDMLRAPALANPYSLTGQLEFVRERWMALLGRYVYRILSGLDLIKEEQMRFGMGGGPGPAQVPVYTALLGAAGAEGEVERFSPDKEWMPRLVLMAKNSYVWLHQLSQKYQRPIHTLDQIPDEELQALANAGFSGLWLIGLWERSDASRRIKQIMGNTDAVASAYSLAYYQIAGDLGGQPAYESLRDRAWRFGIRLASDMVPNHMGIDSPWVMEHPDWFVQLDHSPFPAYSFNGPDLSNDGRVGIFLEDHYYDRTDASVVFKRVDRGSGQERYVYHGNDGTSMPWNDTAQLNYLNPEVREAVIQTILHVARQFPIIRFDAAMTLAKKHYQRLWFPEPGTGGAIPSRSEYGLTREQFDAAMPVEFWREVVDRAAVEAPDTLLLAEAFWMMEGYFVRTLGMHRVYNSAFMNMLRNEDNANYRLLMKNTLEFDPEILKRYVNFMNNPDERTAVDQFGKGDKYFGIATLMATLPGLPMFGHGQVEGFAEKYGMEFRRPMWEEQVDPGLVERHRREIFPLLHRRYLFAGVENFLLYDFATPEGGVNEDVFAYSNGVGQERALVVYHNRFGSARGWVRTSAAYLEKSGDRRALVQKSVGEGLGLHYNQGHYLIYHDLISGMEYIRASTQVFEQGLYFELDAYKYAVLVDIREVQDDEMHQYGQLAAYLGGRGVPNLQEALEEIFLASIQQPYRQLVNPGMFRYLLDNVVIDPRKSASRVLLAEVEMKYEKLLTEAKAFSGGTQDVKPLAEGLKRNVKAALELLVMDKRFPLPGSQRYGPAIHFIQERLENNDALWITVFGWLFMHQLGRVVDLEDHEDTSRSWIDEWNLGRVFASTARALGLEEEDVARSLNTIRLLTLHQCWFDKNGTDSPRQLVEDWLKDAEIQRFLGINRFRDRLWYNKEAYESLLWWMMFLAVMEIIENPKTSASHMVEQVVASYDVIDRLQDAETQSDYQIEKLLDALSEPLQEE